MSSLSLNFHSLISVWAPDLPEAAQRPFRRHFQPFLQESELPPEDVDILLVQMRGEPKLDTSNQHVSAIFGFSIFFYEGASVVGLLQRGQPDILVQLTDNITIYYRDRAGVEGRLYGAVLWGIYLAARLKGCLIMHGVVVEREGQGVFICGHRGMKKTQLLLTFLRQGWNYVSDDKFLLDGNQACLFEPLVSVRNYHYLIFPWLEKRLPRSTLSRTLYRLGYPVQSLVRTWAPRRLQPLFERRLDPVRQAPAQVIVPACKVTPKVTLSHGFTLLCGEQFSIQSQTVELAASRLQAIYELMHVDISAMEQSTLLYSAKILQPVPTLMSRLLADVPVSSITLPDSVNLDTVYSAMVQHCAES